MRWPWCRREDDVPAVSDDAAEASEARRCAELALELSKERSDEIREVAAMARSHRRVNHFAQLIDDTFRGR